MPLYEYQCESCAQRFERIQKYSDPAIATCPACNGPVRKLPSSPAIQFKGTGWYITDYAKKSPSGDSKSGEASKDTKDTKDTKDSSSSDAGGSTSTTSKESTDSKAASKDSSDRSGGTKSAGTKND